MLSKKAKYAIHALRCLASRGQGIQMTIAEIAAQERIPKKFLEAILRDLKSEGWVTSTSGPHGGYMLLVAPDSISLADVHRKFDGAIALIPCATHRFFQPCVECQSIDSCTIRQAFLVVREREVMALKGISMADL
jgi:Rrf2 family protein